MTFDPSDKFEREPKFIISDHFAEERRWAEEKQRERMRSDSTKAREVELALQEKLRKYHQDQLQAGIDAVERERERMRERTREEISKRLPQKNSEALSFNLSHNVWPEQVDAIEPFTFDTPKTIEPLLTFEQSLYQSNVNPERILDYVSPDEDVTRLPDLGYLPEDLFPFSDQE